MAYSIYVTDIAQEFLDSIVFYLLLEKNSEQAARAVLDDYDETIDILSNVADNLGFCTNPILREQGYKRISFRRHDYYILYRIENNLVIVDNVYHVLEDYENKIK